MLFYRTMTVTSSKGLEMSDRQLIFIENMTSIPDLIIDMVKYQTTNDVIGFSFTGVRKQSDFDTTFTYLTPINVVEKQPKYSSTLQFEQMMGPMIEKPEIWLSDQF